MAEHSGVPADGVKEEVPGSFMFELARADNVVAVLKKMFLYSVYEAVLLSAASELSEIQTDPLITHESQYWLTDACTAIVVSTEQPVSQLGEQVVDGPVVDCFGEEDMRAWAS